MLVRIVRRDVDLDEPRAGALKQSTRAAGEILQARADADDEISLAAASFAALEPVTPIEPSALG
jgi:hypothetical protein